MGYQDGMLKWFIIKNYKLIRGALHGMEIFSENKVLVTDESSIYFLDRTTQKLIWEKSGWHSGACYIQLNKAKTLLLTGSNDYLVNLMKVENQLKIWGCKLNGSVNGLIWTPEEN